MDRMTEQTIQTFFLVPITFASLPLLSSASSSLLHVNDFLYNFLHDWEKEEMFEQEMVGCSRYKNVRITLLYSLDGQLLTKPKEGK